VATDVASADAEREPDSRPKAAEEKPDGTAAAPAAPGGGLGGRQVQAKAAPGNAALGAADAPAERAADSAADRVLRMTEPAAPAPPAPTSAEPPAPGPAAPGPAAPGSGSGPPVQRAADPAADQRLPGAPQATPARPGGTASAGGAAPDTTTPAGVPGPIADPASTGGPAPAAGAGSGTPAPDPEPPAPEGEAPSRETPRVPDDVQSYLDASRGQGAPLPEASRTMFETAYRRPLDDVRIHDDGAADNAARAIDALAFTRGTDIYFRSGAYDPTSAEGKRLLAHELAHVVAQRPGVNRSASPGLGGAVVQRNKKKGDADQKDEKNQKDDPKPGPEWTPPSGSTAPKGTINSSSRTLEIEVLPFPRWKEKASGLAAGPYVWRRDERGDTPQLENWKKGVRDDTRSLTRKHLEELYGTKSDGEPYFVKSGTSTKMARTDYYVGSPDEIAEMILVPTWSRTTEEYRRFHVDHKIDWKLSGGDRFPNIWLFDREVNQEEGPKQLGRMRDAVREFTEEARPHLKPRPAVETVVNSYKVKFNTLKFVGRAAAAGEFWERKHAATEKHVCGLKKLTARQIRSLGGKEGDLRIFSGERGGRVRPLPYDTTTMKPKETWKKETGSGQSFQVQEVAFTKISDKGGAGSAGRVAGIAFKDNAWIEKTPFEIGLGGIPGLPYGAALLKKDIKAEMKAKGLSPIKFDDLDFDPFDGFVGRGSILPDIRLLKNVDVGLVLAGGGIGIEAVVTGDALSLPAPLKVTGGMVRLYAGSEGLAVEGQLNLEIEKLATGHIGAKAGTKNGQAKFELDGELEFDTEMFTKARLGLSYKDGKWGVQGELAVGPDKIKGIKSATAKVDVTENGVTATGEFETSLKGVEKGTLGFVYDKATGMAISGEILLGKGIPGIKGGKLAATVKEGAEGWSLAGAVTAEPDVPGLTGTVSGSYADGAFGVEADLGYERGQAKGRVKVGLTNRTLDAEGKPAGPVAKDGSLTAYGGGAVTLAITPWLQGTVGLKLTPKGEIEVSGQVEMPKQFDVFDEKKVERKVFSIGIDIPIIGVAVAGQRIGIFATIKGGMTIAAGFGPGQLRDVALAVTYNPDKPDDTTVTGTGTFVVPAHAGLHLQVDGGLGAGIPVVSATAGVSIYGEVGLEGAASASAAISWTPRTGIVLDARGEIFVEPKFRFGIDAFVDVTADLWVTEIELYHKKWKLAAFEYGSNLRFGLAFPLHYESGKPFDLSFDQIQWTYPQINPGDLLGGLMKQLVG
jgi:hypothetical protein